MADNEVVINGVDDASSEFDDSTAALSSSAERDDGHVDQMNHRIEALGSENADMKERFHEVKEGEIERSDSESKALESIAKRAADLETEVARLQSDLITSMNVGEEANREILGLRREIEDLKREKASLSERLDVQIAALSRSESAKESNIIVLQEKEREIGLLKRELKDVEQSMAILEAKLKKSEEKEKEMESKLSQLIRKSEESDKVISGLMEKAAERDVDGIAEDQNSGFSGLTLPVPVAGALTTAVVVAALAICYIKYSRTK